MFLYATCACHVSKDHLHHCNTSVCFFSGLGSPSSYQTKHWKTTICKWFSHQHLHLSIYIYMDFQLPCLMTRRQFCLRFLVENMRKIYRPQHIPESSTIERWRMLLCFMISAWLIGLNPDILALIQRQDNHRCWHMPISQFWVKQPHCLRGKTIV